MAALRPNTTTRSNPLPMDEDLEAVITLVYTSPDGGTSWEPGTNPTGTTDGLTNAELRASPVAVTGDFASDGLTDAELRATPVAVTVTGGVTSDGLTDAELRATPVVISGTVNLGTIDGAATEVTLAAILTELNQKLEAGQAVALDAPTLAALENITATLSGPVALDAATLSALESITAVVSGTVALDAPTLAALESITAIISGSVAVTGPLTDAQLRATALPVVNTETRPSTATLSNVAGSASSVTLQASNANRRGLTIVNDSTAECYVKFGSTASTTSYTVKLGAGDYYELPTPIYTGIVTGIWASATGNARVTEIA